MGSKARARAPAVADYAIGTSTVVVAGLGAAAAPVVTMASAVTMVVVALARHWKALGLLATTVGALFSFRGTDDPTTVEAIFVLVVLTVSFRGALIAGSKGYHSASVAAVSGLTAVAIAAFVGVTAGHTFIAVVRDAAPYILVLMLPLLSLAMTPRWKGIQLVGGIVAVLAYLSFVLTWMDHRGLGPEIQAAGWILPSFTLIIAATAYLSVRMFDEVAVPYLPVALFVILILGLGLTGTRVSLLLLLGPGIAALTTSRGSRRWWRLVRAGGLLVLFATFVLVAIRGYIPEAAVEFLQSRAASTREILVGDVSADQSAAARIAATRSAIDSLAGNPIVGSGLGVPFIFVSPYGREQLHHSDFTIDSSVATFAKFGFLGSLLLVVSLFVLVSRLIPRGTRVRRVAVVFGTLGLVYSPFLPMLEDKGLGIALLLLVLSGQIEVRERCRREAD